MQIERFQPRAVTDAAAASLLGRVSSPDRDAAVNDRDFGPRPSAALAPEPIDVIRAGVGNTVRMIPLDEVVCFEATDKYVNVVTPGFEALIGMSLRDLAGRLADGRFILVRRGLLVNARRILSATRDDCGRWSLSLAGLQRPLRVSRGCAHLFRPM